MRWLQRWRVQRAQRVLDKLGMRTMRAGVVSEVLTDVHQLRDYAKRSGALMAENDRRVHAFYAVIATCDQIERLLIRGAVEVR